MSKRRTVLQESACQAPQSQVADSDQPDSQRYSRMMPSLTDVLLVACFSLFATAASTPKLVPYQENGKNYQCKCSPADECWPKANAWEKLNKTVGGNLIRHIPPAAVCYNQFRGVATYDAA
ncbi:hypothetical protein CH063_14225, partial [Colletotrichum higginsianum]